MVFGVANPKKNGIAPVTTSLPRSGYGQSQVNNIYQTPANADAVVHQAWEEYGDPRRIDHLEEVSAHVSTNRVFRVHFTDSSHVVAKVSSYGSYFLFAEDHDRLFRLHNQLQATRWHGFLAQVLDKNGRPYTWYDGRCWAAFYIDVERREALPRILSDDQVGCFGREIAEFHLSCAEVAPRLPPMSNSVKSDAIHLLDQLTNAFAPRNFSLHAEDIGVLWKSTHEFLEYLDNVHYDEWQNIPILVDWNLSNFSVESTNKGFKLYSRWDYDWFRVDSRLLDFYFLSRVSSRTGDRTQFSYSPHTLVEPRFLTFVRAYHEVNPLSESDIRFLPYAYRFFILNYVIREGARFFRADLCTQFRREVARSYLPQLEQLDISPLLDIVMT
jgi:hypothetical protein